MSARRRGESGLSGILLVDKPSGLSSHDVVNRIRRATGEGRVGHAGTLDPMATGLLVVLVGPATRLAPYLTAAEKAYAARIVFGTETDTDDAEGRVTHEAELPSLLCDAAAASETVAALVGTHEQVPPAYSAIKRDGVTAYKAARAGEDLELEPRTVEIASASLIEIDAGPPPAWVVELAVSKGTYVRAIARDLGRSLGTAAHLAGLRRTRSGALAIEDSTALADLEAAEPSQIAAHFADPLAALALPIAEVGEAGAVRISTGSTLDPDAHCVDGCPNADAVAIARDGVLLAVYARTGAILRPQTVLPGGVRGGVA